VVHTIVVREITPTKLAVIPATVPGNGGYLPFWVPVVVSVSTSLIPYFPAAATTLSSRCRPSGISLMVACPPLRIFHVVRLDSDLVTIRIPESKVLKLVH